MRLACSARAAILRKKRDLCLTFSTWHKKNHLFSLPYLFFPDLKGQKKQMGGRGFLQGFILERCFWLDVKNSLYRLFRADKRKIHTSCQKWPILSYIGLDKAIQAH